MRWIAISLCMCLAGCSDWPETGAPRATGDWPQLLPLDQVLAGDQVIRAEDRDADDLARRAAALRARAAILRGDSSDLDAVRRRLSR